MGRMEKEAGLKKEGAQREGARVRGPTTMGNVMPSSGRTSSSSGAREVTKAIRRRGTTTTAIFRT
jgi:hypothetical protein